MVHISQFEQDGVLTIFYEGELDQHAARSVIDQSEDLMALYPCRKLVLELSGLTFMDSSGLAVVLHLFRTCAKFGYDFVVKGTPCQPMRVFTAAGLPKIMIFEGGDGE